MDSLERLLLYRKKLIITSYLSSHKLVHVDYVFLRNPVFGYFGL